MLSIFFKIKNHDSSGEIRFHITLERKHKTKLNYYVPKVVKVSSMFNSYNSSAVQKNLNPLQAFIFAIWCYLKYLMAINFIDLWQKRKPQNL